MNFENITPINYTRLIEPDPSDFIYSSEAGPIYVFQKFFVETNQYVNNVSVFLQDINFGSGSEESSWEVALLNCSNDVSGTPNAEIGKLIKAPPINIAAHWEVFNFRDDGDGPIFLNISKTQKITENGVIKYWFALRIKIPQTEKLGSEGLPKFLYFNPDGGSDTNIGEGQTFLKSPDIRIDNYTLNNVVDYEISNGTKGDGTIASFGDRTDENRFFVDSDNNNMVNFTTKFELHNLTEWSFEDLNYIITYFREAWYRYHYEFMYSIDIYLSINVSDSTVIQNADVYYERPNAIGPGPPKLINLTGNFNGSIKKNGEQFLIYRIRDPTDKLNFIKSVTANENNSINFRFAYQGTNSFNVSVNQFTIEIGELISLDKVKPYDPLIQRLYYIENFTLYNGTKIDTGYNHKTALKANDGKIFGAKADNHNITIEFEAEILSDIDNSLWEDVDFYDWILSYPNPIIPLIDVRIRSKTNVSNVDDLNLAVLEIYKGGYTSNFLSPEENVEDWIQISKRNNTFAYNQETLNVTKLDAGITWILLQYLNLSGQNIVKFRLRYNTTNPTDYGFNVTIDEFTLNIYIQNAISSDIASKIGLGLKTATLLPEDIQMKNFGTLISNVDNQKGSWRGNVPGGIPTQGIFDLNITSLWHAITFDVIGTYQIYKMAIELDFEADLETQYMMGTEYFKIEVMDSNGLPISNLEITFELLDPDGKVLDDNTAVTDSEGVAEGGLELEDLGEGFMIRVIYEQLGIYGSEEIESDEFRVVDDFTLFMDGFLQFLPYLLIGLAGLLTFAVLMHRSANKKREFWAGESMILEDLLKISYIMIIHKETGLTLYNTQISLDLDSDLISGFITAISQFRSEIKKPKGESNTGAGFEMDYHDFKIEIVDGDYIRTAFILEGAPSEKLKENQRAFTDKFETKFGPLIKDFAGNIKPFRETGAIIENIFNISLMFPFQLGKHWKFTKLNKLENVLMEVAEQMQKERKYFFVSSLLNYGLAGRKESKNEIISTIIALKRRELFVPIKNI